MFRGRDQEIRHGMLRPAIGAFAVVALVVSGSSWRGSRRSSTATPQTGRRLLRDHHKQVLIAVVLVAIGLAIYLVRPRLSSRSYLRERGERSLAAVVLAGAAASAGLFAVGDALYGVIAQAVAVARRRPGLAKALYQLDQFAGIPMYWLVLAADRLGRDRAAHAASSRAGPSG